MNNLKKLVESYQPTTYTRVKRNEQTHKESEKLAEQEIMRNNMNIEKKEMIENIITTVILKISKQYEIHND